MYRSCIFCSADLRANDALERFPVGRSIAFDGERGRLWAVCPACARWNLAPIEERWEAIEDAERLFRDTRTRVQRENVGLAKLPDGTRIIRIGEALAGELAVWRYGESLVRRRRRFLLAGGISTSLGFAFYTAATGGMVAAAGLTYVGWGAVDAIRRGRHKPLYVLAENGAGPGASRVRVRRRDLAAARLAAGDDGVELHLPAHWRRRRELHVPDAGTDALVLRGADARMALGRVMAAVNVAGGTRTKLDAALDVIQHAGSPERLLLDVARQRLHVDGARNRVSWRDALKRMSAWQYQEPSLDDITRQEAASRPDPLMSLAVEMALHEETERRALAGELAALEEMWRQAEEIAAIADRLPDQAGEDTAGI